MKRILSCFLFLLLLSLNGCQKEEVIEDGDFKVLNADAELFTYEETKGVDAIAVDEKGYLYTVTCITEETETNTELKDATEYVYEPCVQQFKVYDLKGNCVEEAQANLGTGTVSFLLVEGDVLYCVVGDGDLTTWGSALYTIDIKTWEVTKLYQFNDYEYLTNFTHVGEYFYVIGRLKEAPAKEYALHLDIDSYTYLGEQVSRIKLGGETIKEEILPIDFPIDIVGTKNDTLLIYHYNEEKGFGFLEFNPTELTLNEVGWTEHRQKVSDFVVCEDGFLFSKPTEGIFYGTSDGLEGSIVPKGTFIRDIPAYEQGFLFYNTGTIQRVGIAELLKKNKPISLLIPEEVPHEPFDNGYQLVKKIFDLDHFALKILAQDTDFDMYLLDSRDSVSYNIKEKGAFYALNEVEGVQEYLDACFPYIKETAINEDGDIWMIPVAVAMPTLYYHKEYCEEQNVDWSTMTFEQFLTLTQEIETTASEEGSISTYLIIEEFFKQYLSAYDSFDTELFRTYAKQIRLLQESVGTLRLSNSNVFSVRTVTRVGIDTPYYTEEELEKIPKFFYEYELYSSPLSSYTEKLGSSDMIGVTRVPMLSEGIKNVGLLTFLAVNPQSNNLEVTLNYISDFCQYMMTQKDSFLLADEAMYTDTPSIKECYQVYSDGNIYFAMDGDIYWNTFWDYVEGELELEEMIGEIERKREIYVGE